MVLMKYIKNPVKERDQFIVSLEQKEDFFSGRILLNRLFDETFALRLLKKGKT